MSQLVQVALAEDATEAEELGEAESNKTLATE